MTKVFHRFLPEKTLAAFGLQLTLTNTHEDLTQVSKVLFGTDREHKQVIHVRCCTLIQQIPKSLID